MFKKILISFDGSDHAEAALRMATDLADRYQAELDIVHVPEVETTALVVGASAVLIPIHEEEVKERAEKLLANAVSIARQAGHVTPSTHLLQGSPAEAIIVHAANSGVDLIVAGRRGLGTLRGMLVGSVSQKLTSHASCPVLTVH